MKLYVKTVVMATLLCTTMQTKMMDKQGPSYIAHIVKPECSFELEIRYECHNPEITEKIVQESLKAAVSPLGNQPAEVLHRLLVNDALIVRAGLQERLSNSHIDILSVTLAHFQPR